MIKNVILLFGWLIWHVQAKFQIDSKFTTNAETDFCNVRNLLGLTFNGKMLKATTNETIVSWGSPIEKTRAYYFHYIPHKDFTNFQAQIESDDEYKHYVAVTGIYFAHEDAYLEVYRAMRNKDNSDTMATLAYNVFHQVSHGKLTQLSDLTYRDPSLYHLRSSGKIANIPEWENDFFPKNFVQENQHEEKIELGSNTWLRLNSDQRIVLFAPIQTYNQTLCGETLGKAVMIEENGDFTNVYCIDLQGGTSEGPFQNHLLGFQIIGVFEHQNRRFIMGKSKKPGYWVREILTLQPFNFQNSTKVRIIFLNFFNCYDELFPDSVVKSYIYIGAFIAALVFLVAVFQFTSKWELPNQKRRHNKHKSLWGKTRLNPGDTVSTISSKYLQTTSTGSVYFDADKKMLDEQLILNEIENEAKRVMDVQTRSKLAEKLK